MNLTDKLYGEAVWDLFNIRYSFHLSEIGSIQIGHRTETSGYVTSSRLNPEITKGYIKECLEHIDQIGENFSEEERKHIVMGVGIALSEADYRKAICMTFVPREYSGIDERIQEILAKMSLNLTRWHTENGDAEPKDASEYHAGLMRFYDYTQNRVNKNDRKPTYMGLCR